MATRLLFSLMFAGLTSFISPEIAGSLTDSLTQLQDFAQITQSDAIYVLREGRPIFYYQTQADNPSLDAHEITHSVIALAALLLIDEGKLPCLDVPIKHIHDADSIHCNSTLTLRDLLSNTLTPSAETRIAALLEVIEKAAGQPIESYLLKRLFIPLGIQNLAWSSSGPSPHLAISAGDLARLGMMIADKGLYFGNRIISEKALAPLFQPAQETNPFIGLQWNLQLHDTGIWWDSELLQAYRDAGLNEEIISRLEALQGQVVYCSGSFFKTYYLSMEPGDLLASFGSIDNAIAFIGDTQCAELPMARFSPGGVKSISATGQGGQQLVIIPRKKLVAVRQKQESWAFTDDNDNASFVKIVENITDATQYPPLLPTQSQNVGCQ